MDWSLWCDALGYCTLPRWPDAMVIQIEEFIENLNLEEFIPEYRSTIENIYRKQFEDLAKLGWAIPPHFAFLGAEYLSPTNNNAESIAKRFLKEYRKDNYNLVEVVIANCKHLDQEVMEQALWCIKRKYYKVCLPALLAILEGVLSEKLHINKTKDIKYLNPLESHIESDKYVGIQIFTALSIKSYIQELFKRSDFSNREPININRHWLLHGRSYLNRDDSDVIKIINSIAAIDSLEEWGIK